MTLTKETIDKIKQEAKDYALNLTFPLTWSSERVDGARDDGATDYESGATEWAGKAQGLIDALEKIIKLNRQNALDQYGDAEKAETWSCVVIAREAIAKYKEAGNG